jgi:hypothetical protein
MHATATLAPASQLHASANDSVCRRCQAGGKFCSRVRFYFPQTALERRRYLKACFWP